MTQLEDPGLQPVGGHSIRKPVRDELRRLIAVVVG
jgi:hypothetical protein